MYWPLSDAPVSGATVTTGYLEIAPAEGSLHETAAPSVYFQHTMVGHMCARRRVFHAWYARRPIGRHRIESMLVQEMVRPSGGHRCSTSLGLPLLHVLVAGWEADIGGSFYWSSVRMLPGLPCLVNV